MLLGFVEPKSERPIWTYCKEERKRNFQILIWIKISSRCQVGHTPEDMSIRTHLDNINKR